MVAWYDRELDLPEIPDRTKRLLERLRDRLQQNERFARSYRAVESAYQEQGDLTKDFEGRITVADAQVVTRKQLALEIDRGIRDLNDEIDQREYAIDSLRRDLYYPKLHSFGQRRYYYLYRQIRGEARARIRHEERAIDELKLKIRLLRREGEGALADLKVKQSELDRLRRQMRQAMERVERRFRWDPPAVDGVVTDEIDHFPPLPADQQAAPDDPETAAEKRLDLARLYLRNDLHQRAAEILRQIVATYGATQAAREAKILLAGLRVPRQPEAEDRRDR